MKSKIEMWRDHEGLHFLGFVADAEYPRLDAFDAALVRDCDGEDATASDRLLALECIFRRGEQQAPNVKVTGAAPDSQQTKAQEVEK